MGHDSQAENHWSRANINTLHSYAVYFKVLLTRGNLSKISNIYDLKINDFSRCALRYQFCNWFNVLLDLRADKWSFSRYTCFRSFDQQHCVDCQLNRNECMSDWQL